MRVIIRCAGQATRWEDFQGIPKHLVHLAGEPVLYRTVRLVGEITPSADVKVVVRDLTDARYKVPGSSRSVDKPDPTAGDVDKILSSAHLFDRKGRTVILWGDTWWTREDLQAILTEPVDGWGAWLRLSGHGGELFGFAFTPDTIPEIVGACEKVADAHRTGASLHAGYNGNPVRGGWGLYRTLTGHAIDDHGDHGHAFPVSLWTDDMDAPRDWDEWCYRWAMTAPADRPR